MLTKSRWRRLQKLVKHEISINLAKLEVIELYVNVGFGSCDYREDVIDESLRQLFELLKGSLPKQLLLSDEFKDFYKNPEIYGMQERLEMWYDQVILAELYTYANYYALTRGYLSIGDDIKKCPYCHSNKIALRDTHYDERGTIEAAIYCGKCNRGLSYWAYGDTDVLSFLDKLIELKGW